jgi:hypothetical protein
MNEDLRLRTKAFALRIIRMTSELLAIFTTNSKKTKARLS